MDFSFADGLGLIQLVVLTVAAYFLYGPVRDFLRARAAQNDHSLLTQAANRVVAAVEQVMVEATGPEKLHRAVTELDEMATLYGISLSEAQAVVFIEAAVGNLRTWVLDDGTELSIADGLDVEVDGGELVSVKLDY